VIRNAKIPARKIADIGAAVQFIRTLAFVDSDRIGCVAVCASAQYTLRALADGVPIRSFASVAAWFHDPASIAPFYGGDEGVALRLGRARDALSRFVHDGEVTMAPAYKEGDDRASMHFRLDYYGLSSRGAVPAWSNEMAEMTWMYWLSFDGLLGHRRFDAFVVRPFRRLCVSETHEASARCSHRPEGAGLGRR
jgi:uncharacterized protein